MKIKHIALSLLLIIFNISTVLSQNNEYANEWKKVDQLEKKGLTQDALNEVKKIALAAARAQNQPQSIKAAMYQVRYRNMVEEDAAEKNMIFLDSLIARSAAPAKNILQSMKAELLNNYKQQNRWKFYDRNPLTVEDGNDISTWSLEKLVSITAGLYHASLQNEDLLKKTSLNNWNAILEKGNSRQLRPTLYDLLTHRALDFFMDQENDITQPAYKFILNDVRIFAPVAEFTQAKFTTADTSSRLYNALLLLQKLLKFHLNDANKDALLDADLKRLRFANEHGIFSNKEKLYEDALLSIEKNYPASAYAAMAKYLRAVEYSRRGSLYHPFTHKENQFDIVKAKALLEEIIKSSPKTEAGINAKNMLSQINRPVLNLQTEKVNIPNEPFRSLVTYKNAQTIYLKAIKAERTELRQAEMNNADAFWSSLAKRAAVKSWTVSLPDLKDMQEHAAEIKIDALPIGNYIILASIKPDFSLTDNIIARQNILVSNLSYFYNNEKELYVLNRNSGEPIAKATVTVWEETYNYSKRELIQTKREVFNTDKNGFTRISIPANRYNNFFQVSYGNDELFTNDNYYSYNYDSYRKQRLLRTFLFTDRSIYRPGQTVFFKGIVVSTDTSGRKSEVVAGQKASLVLYDANRQKISSIDLVSNEYGSVNGSFKLPEGLLNGQFVIVDESTKSEQYFSVEEYKRPRFVVEIKKPEGTYRVNDIIKVTGNAKAYAGNNIDAANVAYRVVRKVRYPMWFGWGYRIWPPYGNREQMEISNGTTKTDADGNFTIEFKAIPDETTDKKNQPIFDYEVIADVTDINGETRSNSIIVAVAYQALQLNINSEEKIPADSLKTIGISSTNMNGLFEKTTVNVVMHKLQEPGRIFRSRYWEMPDQFVMSKEEFNRLFPNDPYADEDQVNKWPLGAKVIDKTDTTSANGNFNIGSKQLASGWYKIIAATKDKYGEEVKAEKFIYIRDARENKVDEPIIINVEKKNVEPGEKTGYSVLTGFDKIWLIQNLSRTGNKRTTSYNDVAAGKPFTNEINTSENDRGGILLNYAFVKNNRFYSGNENMNVPWTNKDLQVSFSTFRDKLLPGAEEKWTMKITGAKGEKIASELLLGMYDASLDQFKPHSWSSLKSIWPTNNAQLNWTPNNFQAVRSDERYGYKYDYQEPIEKTYDALAGSGWSIGDADGRRYKTMRVEAAVVAPPAPGMLDRVQSSNENNAIAGKVFGMQVRNVSGNQQLEEPQADSALQIKSGAQNITGGDIQLRKNFNETAFFFPALTTDAEGNVSFSFTMPEALTQWKLISLAHTKELASAYSEKMVITQKPLMVQPNAPRFIREGDDMELPAKIVNMSDKEITGTAQLELLDAATGKPVDGWFKNVFPTQYFTVEPGKSVAVKFPFGAPYQFNSALTYRIKAVAKDGSFSDGEEMAIPVLTNRMLVTETMPLNMRNTTSKIFSFDKLLQSGNSSSLSQHAFTIEYTSNPAWYAVQALPYLMEYPYECAEQNFNRYYANALAAMVANSTPKIKAVFEKWRTQDTAALMSNLQKNEELKSALLQETPWVLQARSEAEQKRNIAILFDLVRLAKEKQSTLLKLKESQSVNGGFPWFKGGQDDRYITQYIVTGIGHLKKLKALAKEDESIIDQILDKAIPYLDARLRDDHEQLLKSKAKLTDNHLSMQAIQYLYMRSFFNDRTIAASARTAQSYYRGQAQKYWLSQSKYLQGMIALSLQRSADEKTAKAIVESLKQNAIVSEELGMYWKEFTTGGYFWHQAPVESQALMIEAFSDISKDQKLVDDLKTWLLKQKQVQNWKTTKATSEAVYALLMNGSNWLSEEKTITIQLGNTVIKSDASNSEAGTGYFKQSFTAQQVKPEMGNIKVQVTPAAGGNTTSSTWGAAYWQYWEDLDKITAAATPLQLKKKLFVEKAGDRGPVLQELKDGETLKVGDKVKVRIELKVDRDMEYVHLKDMRAATMEPVNVISQYKWQGGLGYYESTKDASTNFFFSWLPRGSYVFEYALFVNQIGNFSNGISTIQSMYAPEFSSHSEGIRVRVE